MQAVGVLGRLAECTAKHPDDVLTHIDGALLVELWRFRAARPVRFEPAG
jgi:hypothetical protein